MSRTLRNYRGNTFPMEMFKTIIKIKILKKDLCIVVMDGHQKQEVV